MPKRIAGDTASVMKVAELQAKLDAARQELEATKKQLDESRAKLQQRAPLIADAAHALSWALSHPDFQAGGKYHQGALGTGFPVLRALNGASGNTGGSPAPLVSSPAESSTDAGLPAPPPAEG